MLAELLAGDEAERGEVDARKQLQSFEERLQWPDLAPVALGRRGMAEDHHHVYGLALEEQHAEYRKALSRSDPGIVDAETRRRLRAAGHLSDPTSDAYHEAGMTILRAHVRAYGLMLDRQRGDAVTTPSPAAGRGPKLSESFTAWKAGSGARGGRQPTAGTLLEAEYAVRRLTEWHGDVRLGALTREMAHDFRNALEQVPTRLPNKGNNIPDSVLHL